MRKLLGVLALSTVFAIGTAVPVSAGSPTDVVGAANCDAATGNQVITWTFTNRVAGLANVANGTATSGLTAGSISSTVVVMTPQTGLISLATSTGQTIASNDAVGTVSIDLQWYDVALDQFHNVTRTVTLQAVCAPAPTTTTTAVAAANGQLPHVGQGTGTLPWIALGLVGAGLAFASLGRRPRRV